MKKILAKLLPQWMLESIRVIRTSVRYSFENQYWFWWEITHSFLLSNKKSDLAVLMIYSHVLEKGITMPNRKTGFGYDRIRMIINLTKRAIDKYASDCIEIQSTLTDLEQYLRLHETAGFSLPNDITTGITELLKYKTVNTVSCYENNASNYFSKTNDFSEFAKQRHSVRWYKENSPINKDTIFQAIQLAQTAPSACNRQSTKVYVIEDADIKKRVLDMQNGNRGFGFLADKIILLTADMRYWNYKERTSAYLDAGIFCMNLLYALHYYKIGACTLNAHLSISQKRTLRQLLNYDKAEMPVVFIAIGEVPDKFMICGSQRLNTEEICKFL